MKLCVGTSGYSFPEWKGSFYPADLPAARMLQFYGQRFQTVEINSTFYRMPSESTLKSWSAQVPEEFAFVLKASRRITHDKRLVDTGDAVAYLVKTASVLEKKLGPLLFQLPPFFRQDLPKLRDFLALIPPDKRVAFEFRHASWFSEEVYNALRGHNAAFCIADAGNELDVPFVPTADWGYLRLRDEDYSDPDLAAWVKRIREQPWHEAFVFFKHEESGRGPQLAARLLELAA
jgi:uncharacterized protein YecE (DUF72 family)